MYRRISISLTRVVIAARRYCYANSVCLSVRPSVTLVINA